MLVIGLTGGVGMGKTTVSDYLRSRGESVADTDEIAREETAPGSEGLSAIRQMFGSQVIDDLGRLNRPALAEIVFANEEKRRGLENILHPRIRARWLAEIDRWRSEGRHRAVVVIPLLFETGAEVEMNRTVCVACTQSTQIRRLGARGWPVEECRRRAAAQWPIERKMDLADAVIWNESTLEVCVQQAARVFDGEEVALDLARRAAGIGQTNIN